MKKGSATVPVLSKYQRRTVKANVIQISNTFQESSWCVKNIFSKADMICSEFDSCFRGNKIFNFEIRSYFVKKIITTLSVLCISESCIEITIKLNFYFHTSLWCLKRFYEDLTRLHKTFWGTIKHCENKNLTYFFLFIRDWDGKG